MKVIEHIEKARGPLFSYEIVPPPRGRSVRDLVEIVEALAPLNPPWIDVTAHASNAYYQENPDGTIAKRTYKKRPGTMGICGIIQNRFRIDTVAHILCLGFTREETEDALIELSYLGIENVLALQGDNPNYSKPTPNNRSTNQFASDLVSQLSHLRQGKFLDEVSTGSYVDFCVGVAGYPEKHIEAANFKTDLQYLKKKVDCGAQYIVTQMFYDNRKYFAFVKACRDAGIDVPIIPGVKIIRNAAQLKTIPKTFHVDLPEELADSVLADPQHANEIGLRWAEKQVDDLLKNGVNNIHFYIMNDTNLVVNLVKKFR